MDVLHIIFKFWNVKKSPIHIYNVVVGYVECSNLGGGSKRFKATSAIDSVDEKFWIFEPERNFKKINKFELIEKNLGAIPGIIVQ